MDLTFWFIGMRALWALVAVRLVCPFSLESPLSRVPDTKVLFSGQWVLWSCWASFLLPENGFADGRVVSEEDG